MNLSQIGSRLLMQGSMRFILASLVVLQHFSSIRLGAYAVYVFFILSGYWVAKMYQEKYRGLQFTYLSWIISRWWRLFPVFIVCLICAIATNSILQLLAPTSNYPPINIVGAIIEASVLFTSFHNDYLPPGWTIGVELQFYLFAPILIWAGIKSLRLIAVILISAVFINIYFIWALEIEDKLWFLSYLGLFITGIAIHRFSLPRNTCFTRISFAILFLLIVTILAFDELRPLILEKQNTSKELFSVWRSGLSYLTAILTVPIIVELLQHPSDSLDRALGNYSYSLYLFHWIPREIYYEAWPFESGFMIKLSGLILFCVLSYLGAYLIYHFVDKPSLKLKRYVTQKFIIVSK